MQKEAEKSKKMQCQTDRSSNINYAWDELSTMGLKDFFYWTRDGRKWKELLQTQVLKNGILLDTWQLYQQAKFTNQWKPGQLPHTSQASPLTINDSTTINFWLN